MRGRWHVIAPDGHPIYDGAPHSKDKPIIFDDEDEAMKCVEICIAEGEGQP